MLFNLILGTLLAANPVEGVGISLTGTASKAVKPDIAHVFMSVSTTSMDLSKAIYENNKKSYDLHNILSGFNKTTFETTNFNVYPNYEERSRKFTGYTVINSITVSICDFSQIGPILSKSTEIGVNQISGLRFDVKNRSAIQENLKVKAIEDAIYKAKTYAQTIDAERIKIENLTESYNDVRPMVYKSVAESVNTPVAEGDQTITASVNISFRFLNVPEIKLKQN